MCRNWYLVKWKKEFFAENSPKIVMCKTTLPTFSNYLTPNASLQTYHFIPSVVHIHHHLINTIHSYCSTTSTFFFTLLDYLLLFFVFNLTRLDNMNTPESTPTIADRKEIKGEKPAAKPAAHADPLRRSFNQVVHHPHHNYYEEHDARIDFRTGMSGHRGGHGAASHPHEVTHDGVKMMSNHSGVGSPTVVKKTKKTWSIY